MASSRTRAYCAIASTIFVAAFFRVAQAQSSPVEINSGWQLQDVVKAADPGDAVSKDSYSTAGWFKAVVPGTVLTTLVNDGVYPDPLFGENDRATVIPDSLCRTSYWYRTQCTVPTAFAGKHIWLNFEGINYAAEVWVNGQKSGEIKGAFARGIFDITKFVQPGSQATIAVKILPPPHPNDNPHEHTIAAGVGSNGGIMTADGPTFISAQGWNWISPVRDRDMGIWQKVTLSASGPVVIRDPFVWAKLPMPRTDTADVNAEATVSNTGDAPQTGSLIGTMSGISFSMPVSLQAGESKTIKITPADMPQLHFANPKLWWPNGLGDPNVYKMHFSFEVGGVATDTSDVTFGIRDIQYTFPGSENLGLTVNGVPILCKGGSWGMDEAMKRIPRERLEAQVRFHAQAHFNMIRNWVGQSTSEDFYELCDKYGLLVWDEFFQPNPSDGPRTGPNPFDNDLYLANVREKVLRFRNHPSIVLWCARNEGDPPPVIDAGIKKIIADFEPQRLYQANSSAGRGARSGGPYRWRTPAEYYEYPTTGRGAEVFKTELGGGVSMPTLESVEKMIPEKDWNTINDDWAIHNFTTGTQAGQLYAGVITGRYGKWSNLAEFVSESQLANYEAYRAMFEGRQAKMFKPVTGVLDWMSNPSIYSFTYQLYAHDLEPMSSLYAAEKACEPVHIQMNQSDFHVMVINNTPAALDGLTATAAIYNMDGSQKKTQSWPATAAATTAMDVAAIEFPTDISPVHFVKVSLTDSSGKVISQNFYWRGTGDNANDFTPLRNLPIVPLQVSIARHDAIGKFLLDVTLSNSSPQNVALLAHLQLRRKTSGERVLPTYYNDNYVSLLGGESRTVRIEAATVDLAGEEPLVMLDGWNITTNSAEFTAGGPSAAALNVAAMRPMTPATKP
jgi:hypothetical protein